MVARRGWGPGPFRNVSETGERATMKVAPTFLDEQGHLSFFGAIDESGDSGYFYNDGFQVFEFHVKEFHGHTAGIDFDIPDFHGAFEGFHPGGNFLRHHLLHHDRAILFEIFTDAHVGLVSILAERFQTPERDKQLDIHAHCSPTSGERGHGHQFINCSGIDNNRHSIFSDTAPLYSCTLLTLSVIQDLRVKISSLFLHYAWVAAKTVCISAT